MNGNKKQQEQALAIKGKVIWIVENKIETQFVDDGYPSTLLLVRAIRFLRECEQCKFWINFFGGEEPTYSRVHQIMARVARNNFAMDAHWLR